MTKDYNTYQRERYKKNRAAHIERQRAYREANRDAINARRRERYKTYKGVANDRFRRWKSENPNYFSDYKRRNKGKINAATAKRYAEKRKRTPPWLNEQHYIAIEACYIEAHRLLELTGIQFHVDHIVPIQSPMVSGLHVPWNLQVLPYYENIAKSNNFSE